LLPINALLEGYGMGKQQTKKQYGRARLDSGHHRRILLIMALLGLAAFVPPCFRLCRLMVAEYDYYRELALRNQTRVTAVAADRGTIFDRNMEVLAASVRVENVYLAPRELKQSGADVQGISLFLGELLDKDPQWIQEQALNRKQRYRQVGSNVDIETAASIREYIRRNNVSGIHLEPSSMRTYPNGPLAAQVIGFANGAGEGVEGIEAAYNSFLTGKTGKVITAKGNNEMDLPYSYENYIAAGSGANVILTLDKVVQSCLEKQMEAAIARYDVQNGAFGLVMDCKTGEILAMATLGSYDPNAYLEIGDPESAARLEQLRLSYLLNSPDTDAFTQGKLRYEQALSEARLKQWRNRILSDGYEPGSTFKILTMAAALDCGAIDLTTSFHCTGAEQIPGRSQLLHCWRSQGHGAQQSPQALQNSCNIAFAHIALKLGGERFYEYIERFGILEKTGIDLIGESKGVFFSRQLITDTDKWGTASLTSGSFGQTFKITPLQLVRAIASVVNGGELLEPYIVSEILDAEGNTLLRQEPTIVRRTVSEQTSSVMRQLIHSVVTDGTAKNAAVAGFSIGGKTGTSEKIDVFDENGQRVLDKIVSFVGIAPMEDPRYIVMVALDTPSRETGIYISGGVMAAPTVGAVMADILPYLGVERDDSGEDPALRQLLLEDCSGMSPGEAADKLEGLGFSVKTVGAGETVMGQLPLPGQVVPGGIQILLYLEEPGTPRQVRVPDFLGLDRQKASDTALSLGLNILVTGNTDLAPSVTVTAQSAAPGTLVSAGTPITLEFTDTAAR